MATTIKLKNGSGAPLAGDLVQGEPALDLTNKRLYTEDSGGTVIEVGTNPSTLTVDTDVLVVDATNNRVGIGTTSPLNKFVVSEGTGQHGIELAPGTTSYIQAYDRAIADYGDLKIDAQIIQFGTDNGTERMRIDASGNVLVGKTSNYGVGETSTLQIKTPLILGQDNTSSADNRNWAIALNGSSAGSLDFIDSASNTGWPNNAYRMVLTKDGNLGIGTTSPGNKLVIATTADANQYLQINNDDTTSFFGSRSDGLCAIETNNSMVFTTGGSYTERMRIDSSGNVGIGAAPVATGYSGVSTTLYVENTSAAAVTVDSSSTGRAYSLVSDATGNFSVFDEDASAVRMRINSSGNVGIGTTSPTANLEISAATSRKIDVVDTTGARVRLSTASGQAFIGSTTAHPLNIITSDAVRATVDASGNVGIGTTSPGARLDLVGPSSTPVVLEVNSANSNCDVTMQSASTSSATRLRNGTNDFQVHTNGTERMRIDSSGNLLVGCTADPSSSVKGMGYGDFAVAGYDTCLVLAAGANTSTDRQISFVNGNGLVGNINTSGTSTTYATSSDQRLKENIVDAPAGNIDAIRVRSFDWKADGSHQTYGMVAQELVDVAPEAVTQGQTEDDMWGVDYSKLVPMMIKEIQDLKAEVAALKGA